VVGWVDPWSAGCCLPSCPAQERSRAVAVKRSPAGPAARRREAVSLDGRGAAQLPGDVVWRLERAALNARRKLLNELRAVPRRGGGARQARDEETRAVYALRYQVRLAHRDRWYVAEVNASEGER
jgi:hypothetical protein